MEASQIVMLGFGLLVLAGLLVPLIGLVLHELGARDQEWPIARR
ncbi:hypothetical protein [Planomonospora sp. ID82291]|nr:hypothetical protein [Planomonospora sp. ID82291]